MDAITFRYLMSLTASNNLEMYLMDVVTAYLYGSLDSEIYMKIPEGFKIPRRVKDAEASKELCSVKLQRSLYGLKQSGRMWYNRLSEYLLSKGYVNNAICPCVFIKKSSTGFVIIAVYVDDLNMIGTQKEIDDARTHMKDEFEMKDLGKTKFCLGLQIEHFQDGIFLHQSNYTKRVLKRFYMDKATPLSSPMVNRSLDVNKDPFRPIEDSEEMLGPEVPYMSAIGALMYLANCTRPDIAFATNLLARYSSSPTRRHWNGIKHIFRYLQGTIEFGLYYSRNPEVGLVGFADAGYLSDPHKARSQTGYVFTYGGTAISGVPKNKLWLQQASGVSTKKEPTTIYEDNSACVTQLKEGYIKSDRTKHIPPRFFSYTQELEKNQEVDIQYVRSSDNAADLFTKALPTTVFKKHVHSIGMRRLQDLNSPSISTRIKILTGYARSFAPASEWTELRGSGRSATEARVSLVLALASQASSASQRLLADLAVETAKYVFPKRFNSSNLEEALMSVPDLETMNFRVLSRTDKYEIREVEPYFVAETTMPAENGFKVFQRVS
ncbi:unnamed protein product [Microthlaspi erraticum]|uniref:Reverse transcriptase Ty1/copia-type domain-containing protein n=1 Tax=Microthlaspi erraticum TaxID=1685480 RepID=A0A6D2KBA5_9BRAS|nr:unnamed protein product [Microthlaspi erraticum]